MTNSPETRATYDDEISLVDLATTFVRRRRVFYVVFSGVIVLALIYVLFLATEEREYTSLVQLSEEQQKAVEPPATVIATIENRWYPELLGRYGELQGDKLPFEINASNPENTTLIKLSSQASPEMSKEVKAVHQQLIEQLTQRQTQMLERRKQELEQRLTSINEYLDSISGQETAGEAAAQAIQNRIDLVARIESLQPAETLVVARASLDDKGSSKISILALAIVLGLMLGIFSAFMAEFVAHVRSSMWEADT